MKRSLKKGFTLVELVIVLALIGIITTAIVMVLQPINKIYINTTNKANEETSTITLTNYLNQELRYATKVQIVVNDGTVPDATGYDRFILLSNDTTIDASLRSSTAINKGAAGYTQGGTVSYINGGGTPCVSAATLDEWNYIFSLADCSDSVGSQYVTLGVTVQRMVQNAAKDAFIPDADNVYEYEETFDLINIQQTVELTADETVVPFSVTKSGDENAIWILYGRAADSDAVKNGSIGNNIVASTEFASYSDSAGIVSPAVDATTIQLYLIAGTSETAFTVTGSKTYFDDDSAITSFTETVSADGTSVHNVTLEGLSSYFEVSGVSGKIKATDASDNGKIYIYNGNVYTSNPLVNPCTIIFKSTSDFRITGDGVVVYDYTGKNVTSTVCSGNMWRPTEYATYTVEFDDGSSYLKIMDQNSSGAYVFNSTYSGVYIIDGGGTSGVSVVETDSSSVTTSDTYSGTLCIEAWDLSGSGSFTIIGTTETSIGSTVYSSTVYDSTANNITTTHQTYTFTYDGVSTFYCNAAAIDGDATKTTITYNYTDYQCVKIGSPADLDGVTLYYYNGYLYTTPPVENLYSQMSDADEIKAAFGSYGGSADDIVCYDDRYILAVDFSGTLDAIYNSSGVSADLYDVTNGTYLGTVSSYGTLYLDSSLSGDIRLAFVMYSGSGSLQLQYYDTVSNEWWPHYETLCTLNFVGSNNSADVQSYG